MPLSEHRKKWEREYRQKNRAKIIEKDRRYKRKNKDRINEKRREKYDRKATNWAIIMDFVREELADFTANGIKPTLRAMHYRLYSKHGNEEKIYARYGNTEKYYWGLSNATTIAREGTHRKNFYGELPIDCFADNTREAIYPKNTEVDYEQPEEHAEKLIEQLKKLPDTFEKSLIPRWLNQPHYVEVWTEKKTMIPTLQSIIGDRDVAIVPLGGHPSVTFLWENATILGQFKSMEYEYIDDNGNTNKAYKKIHVIYLGDLDPSGENIEEVCKRKLRLYGIDNVDFQRLGVTKKQVDDLGLPEDPDPETMDKLERDNNRDNFRFKYGKLMQIEIDALVAYDPEGLKNMVQQAIDEKFDEEIHKKALERYSPEEIREMINKSVKYGFNLRSWW